MIENWDDPIQSEEEDQDDLLEARNRLFKFTFPQSTNAGIIVIRRLDEVLPDLHVSRPHALFRDIQLHATNTVVGCDRRRHKIVNLTDDLDRDEVCQHIEDVCGDDADK